LTCIILQELYEQVDLSEQQSTVVIEETVNEQIVVLEDVCDTVVIDILDTQIDIIEYVQPVELVELVQTIELIDLTGTGTGGGTCTCLGSSAPIETPTDGHWSDGLHQWETTHMIKDALDDLNETLSYLAPAQPGSMDGVAMVASGTTFLTGRLSDGNVNYKPADPAGDASDYIIIDASFTVSPPSPSTLFNMADQGTLKGYINDTEVDTFDLAGNFVEAERAGAQSYPPEDSALNFITVTKVEWFNDFPAWQIGNCRINIDPSDLREGWNKIKLEHVDIGGDQATQEFDVFYDKGTLSSVMTINSVTEKAPINRYLSGVKYYGRGATFDADMIAGNVFDNTYHITSPIVYSSTLNTIGSGIIDYDDSSVSGVSDPPYRTEATMTVDDKVLTVPSSNVRSPDSRLSAYARKVWSTSATVQSASENRLVDAYGITSDDENEYFDDENRRMPSGAYDSIPANITGQWNSVLFLTNGMAQLFMGELIYPELDFSTGYLPSAGQPDYSAFSGNQVYYRAMYDSGDPHSSGILQLGGLVLADVAQVGTGNVNVEIKLPTQTGWMDLGKPFDSGTFTGADGDGCRVTVVGDQWSWTCGTFSTADSGWMIMVRITLRNDSKVITQLREVNW